MFGWLYLVAGVDLLSKKILLAGWWLMADIDLV